MTSRITYIWSSSPQVRDLVLFKINESTDMYTFISDLYLYLDDAGPVADLEIHQRGTCRGGFTSGGLKIRYFHKFCWLIRGPIRSAYADVCLFDWLMGFNARAAIFQLYSGEMKQVKQASEVTDIITYPSYIPCLWCGNKLELFFSYVCCGISPWLTFCDDVNVTNIQKEVYVNKSYIMYSTLLGLDYLPFFYFYGQYQLIQEMSV